MDFNRPGGGLMTPWEKKRERILAESDKAVPVRGETVGPFPAEPAFGSPEAVEQAAETLRGFTPPTAEQQIAYLEREVVHFRDGVCELAAEVERLRAENEDLRSGAPWLNAQGREAHEETERQRDALANALESQRRF